MADAVTDALLWTLQHAGFDPHEGDDSPPAAYWRAKALLYLGVLALRNVRAAMAVISVGYEAEVMTYMRTLMEAHARAQRVVADASGEYARNWLDARAGKPAKAVDGFSPAELWANLSHSSHADHRAIENFIAISNDDGSTTLNIAPERRPDVSNSTLAMLAGEAHDMAAIIAKEPGRTVPHLMQIEAAVRTQFPYTEAAPSDTPDSGADLS